jgi:hypothetical protein
MYMYFLFNKDFVTNCIESIENFACSKTHHLILEKIICVSEDAVIPLYLKLYKIK